LKRETGPIPCEGTEKTTQWSGATGGERTKKEELPKPRLQGAIFAKAMFAREAVLSPTKSGGAESAPLEEPAKRKHQYNQPRRAPKKKDAIRTKRKDHDPPE